MNDAARKTRLDELMQQVNSVRLPAVTRQKPRPNTPWDCTRPPKRTERELLDCLDLRLRYLVFDLEATHRENAILRRILRDQS